MEKKINIQTLTALLALSMGKQKKLCEDFLRELFSIVMDEVSKGENVRIKGFGTFKLVDVEARKSVNVATGEEYEIPGHRKLIFVASKELAVLVNAPFSQFEAIEIDDSVSTKSVDGDSDVESLGETVTLGEAVEREEEFEQKSPELAVFEHEETAESTDNIELAEPIVSDLAEPVVSDTVGTEESEGDTEFSAFSEEKTGKLRFLWGFLAGIAVAAVVILAADYFWLDGRILRGGNEKVDAVAEVNDVKEDAGVVHGNIGKEEPADTTSGFTESGKSEIASEKSETGDEESVPTKPSDRVYDTVTTTRYLTTIAKEHYGNFNLWPIIYEENKAILGHPDRIRPGTKVVVPPLSKYGVDPKNQEQVKEIKRKGVEIYSRYR